MRHLDPPLCVAPRRPRVEVVPVRTALLPASTPGARGRTRPLGSSFKGPFGELDAGGMFTVLEVRAGITSYEDPGWYRHPEGTVAGPMNE